MRITIGKLFVLTAAALIFALLQGCSDSAVESDLDMDREAILAVLDGESDLLGIDGIGDDGVFAFDAPYDTGFRKTVGDTLEPLHIGRRITSHNVNRSIEFLNDSTAVVTIEHSISGVLIIVAYILPDTTQIDTIVKPFDMNMTRKVRMEKNAPHRGRGRRHDWGITGITPAVGGSEPTSIDFSELVFVSSAGDSIVISDPLNTFIDRHNLLSFEPRDSVTVFLTLTNSSGFDERALMRYGARHRGDRGRRPLRDDGVLPDAVADDNVYSGFFRTRRLHDRIAHAFAESIDWGTVFDPVAPVGTRIWGFPYRINHRPPHKRMVEKVELGNSGTR